MEGNINMDLKDIGFWGADWIQLAQVVQGSVEGTCDHNRELTCRQTAAYIPNKNSVRRR
jgi:hypothetical protein